MIRWIGLAAAAVVSGGCAGLDTTAPAMQTYGYAFAPPAFSEFCRRYDDLCDTTSGERVVELTPERKVELELVNRSVNARIRQRNDMEIWGVPDVWSLPTKEGDCEDFAILKKSELMKRGWPAAALLLTVARPRFSDAGHTVLTVRTSKGDFILDNLTNSISHGGATTYRFFARQSQDEHGQWERL